MRITFINVGYGDAILIQTPDGYTALLDGGGNLDEEFRESPCRVRGIDYLQNQGITCLNAVMISHIHEDHVCGLERILRKIPADRLYVPYPAEPFLRSRRPGHSHSDGGGGGRDFPDAGAADAGSGSEAQVCGALYDAATPGLCAGAAGGNRGRPADRPGSFFK